MIILIDNGHGIETPGKRSPDSSFLEYLWNRQVANRIMDSLLCMRYDARLVVPETNDVTLRNRINRVNTICNKEGVGNVILVSIHSNAAGNGGWMNAKGWSCYTSKGNTKGDRIAECMYDSFELEFQDRKIRTDKSDGDRDYEENFYVLSKSRCPAVLLENFFYDNKEECEWLLKEETKDRIAWAAVRGIIRYINSL